MRIPLLVSLLAATLLLGCHSTGPTRRGSGILIDETREVGSFGAVQLSIPARVTVQVGEPPALHISGDDNLLPDVISEVRGDKLYIELEGDFVTDAHFEITISCPTLAGFAIAGAANVTIEGCTGDKLALVIAGSGTITARGNADHLDASISGSGEFSLGELRAREANLTISGSGEIDVDVQEQLRYAISGSGHIHYRGAPRVSGGISGSGHVSAN